MAAAPLGNCRCPLCGGRARASLSKSGYAVLTCNGCQCQLFTRSPKSDELVRDLIGAEPAAAPAPTPAPAPVRTDPAPPPAPTPAPAPVRTDPPEETRYERHERIAKAPPPPAPAPSQGFGLKWF